jgi:hypothetical protein
VVSGGADVLDSGASKLRVSGMADAKLMYDAHDSIFYATYQRGFVSANGISQAFQSNLFTLGWGQKITRWMNLRINASHVYSSDAIVSETSPAGSNTIAGSFKNFYVAPSLEFRFLRNVIASVNYKYQNQKNTLTDVTGVSNINRSIASVGLQYLWPSLPSLFR